MAIQKTSRIWMWIKVLFILLTIIYSYFSRPSQDYSKVIWSIYSILSLVLLVNELYRYIQHTNRKVFHYLSILFSILISGILLLLINDLQLCIILYYLFLLHDILMIHNKTYSILWNTTLISHICVYILYLVYSAYTQIFTNYNYMYPNDNFNILVVFNNSQLLKTLITYFAMAFFYLVFVLIFNQIRQKAELVNLYVELKDAHQKLKEYTIKAEDLAVEKERNRIAQDIHDSLGHSLTALIMYQDYLEQIIDINLEKSKDVISKSQNLTRQTLTDLRDAVYAIKQENKASCFISSVKSMIIDSINTNRIHVDFNYTENADKLPANIAEALYRTIQEALTNCVRHADATEIGIHLTIGINHLKLIVQDNGCGADDINKNYGLTGIEKRINSLGGIVEFKSKKNNGFIIEVSIPIS